MDPSRDSDLVQVTREVSTNKTLGIASKCRARRISLSCRINLKLHYHYLECTKSDFGDDEEASRLRDL